MEVPTRDLARPFDIGRGPLFRYAPLLRLGPDHAVWDQRYHHIVIDGYSCSLVVRRVADAYTALAAGSPARPSAAPLLAEDDAYRRSPRYRDDRAHWIRALADRPDPVSLSARPPAVGDRFVRRSAHLAPAAGDLVHAAAGQAGTRWSRVLIAAVAAFLHRLTGARDIVLGLTVTGREPEAEAGIPGMASNVLPLRLTVRPDTTPADLIREAAHAVRELLAHQRYRGEDLRRDLDLSEDGPRFFGPVVNIMAFGPQVRFAGHPTTRHGRMHARRRLRARSRPGGLRSFHVSLLRGGGAPLDQLASSSAGLMPIPPDASCGTRG